MLRWAWILLLALSAMSAEARVFSYKDAGLAAYVRGTGGTSSLGKNLFTHADGDESVAASSKYQYGGEIGVMAGLSPMLHLRLGAEVIQHSTLSNQLGDNSSGTEMFSLTSSVFVFNPNAAIEYDYKTNGALRYYGSLGLGYAMITAENSYKMTATGTTQLGVSDFDEKMQGTALSAQLETGLEILFTDNVTFLAGLGYRYLPVKQLKYSSDTAATIANPSGVHKGDVVLNSDGSKRTINLGGIFGSIGFRFYLNFL